MQNVKLNLADLGKYANEKILTASYQERPLNLPGTLPVNHHGIVINTDHGHSFLVESMPDSGTVITNACNMEGNWTNKRMIPISGTKTISDVLKQSTGPNLLVLGNGLVKYLTGGTCIGAAMNAENSLKK